MAVVLNGRLVAERFEEDFKERVSRLKEKLGFVPTLATILVGDDSASVTYVNMKVKACERVGLTSRKIVLPENTTTDELLSVIDELNNDNEVCGILLQHPVPNHIDECKCFDRIAIEKDVDGVNTQSFGKMTMGIDAYASATPLGIIRLLYEYNISLTGKHAVVVGRSQILGKPMAMLLLNENCTVTICHSKTKGLEDILKTADIVVAAIGSPKFIQKEWLKEGVIVVDAGYNEGNVGDVDLDNVKDVAAAYTPVPGGVGPMTINTLIYQTILSAEKLTSNGEFNEE